MGDNYIRDRNGKILGRFDGPWIRSGDGRLLARYDEADDRTRTADGTIVGDGDLRLMLLED